MKKTWKKQDIEQALRQVKTISPDEAVFDRTWYKIEERVRPRPKHFWQHIVWKPWVHPVRWVALAACFCAVVTGTLYQQDATEKNEVASFLVNVSNPIATITRDQNIVKVSTLLSEPAASVPDMSDEVHIDSLATDAIFL